MIQIRSRALGILFFALLPVAAAAPAAAEIDFGVRVGAYIEEPDPFVGLELLTELGSTGWFLNPNLEFVFADERDQISANFDVHYDFKNVGDQYVWAGGGVAVINTDTPQGDDTELGLNLIGGIGWRWQGTTPYAQLKVVIADDTELVAGVGIRF